MQHMSMCCINPRVCVLVRTYKDTHILTPPPKHTHIHVQRFRPRSHGSHAPARSYIGRAYGSRCPPWYLCPPPPPIPPFSPPPLPPSPYVPPRPHAHSHSNAHSHAHAHVNARARARTHTHARTHARTHTQEKRTRQLRWALCQRSRCSLSFRSMCVCVSSYSLSLCPHS